jgi:hypothetical protein
MTTFANALPADLGSADTSRCAELARIANLALGEYITGLAVNPMRAEIRMTQVQRDRALRMAIAQAVCSFRIARAADAFSDPVVMQTHNALSIAAERIGLNNWKAGRDAHVRAGRKASTYHYTPTQEHSEVVTAMSDLLTGRITAEDAMSLLWQYDTVKQRIAS